MGLRGSHPVLILPDWAAAIDGAVKDRDDPTTPERPLQWTSPPLHPIGWCGHCPRPAASVSSMIFHPLSGSISVASLFSIGCESCQSYLILETGHPDLAGGVLSRNRCKTQIRTRCHLITYENRIEISVVADAEEPRVAARRRSKRPFVRMSLGCATGLPAHWGGRQASANARSYPA